MNSRKKILEVLVLVAILVGISSMPFLMSGQLAAVASSVFGSENKNDIVLRAQAKLKELHLYDGNISGLFGLKTKAAIIAFQVSKNIAATGILDTPTQKLLFGDVAAVKEEPVVVAPEPEQEPTDQTIFIDHTDNGDNFLASWVRYVYGGENKTATLRGELALGKKIASYRNEKYSTGFVLKTDDGDYSVQNLSDRNLGEFLGDDVSVSGLLLQDKNNIGLKTVVINYVSKEDPETFFLANTKEGNEDARVWAEKVYQEKSEDVVMSGVLSLSEKPGQYRPEGNPSNLILTVGDRSYTIENISDKKVSPALFLDHKVWLRGRLLSDLNNLGFQTIVINYVEPARSN